MAKLVLKKTYSITEEVEDNNLINNQTSNNKTHTLEDQKNIAKRENSEEVSFRYNHLRKEISTNLTNDKITLSKRQVLLLRKKNIFVSDLNNTNY